MNQVSTGFSASSSPSALAPADRQALAQEPAPRARSRAAGRAGFIVIWKQAADGTWKIHADGFSEVRESAAAAGEGK